MEQTLMPSDEYWAGFFDGEGTISVRRSGYAVRVSVSNTNKEVIEFFHLRFGGGKYRRDRKNRPRWKVLWVCTICNRPQMKAFLSAVYPYLKIKRIQAQLALQILDIVGQGWIKSKKVQQRRTRRKELVEQIAKENTKGDSRAKLLNEMSST